jgi:hypothetical protein
MTEPGTHELKLWASHGARYQPRDAKGRFVRVRLSPERRKVLERAAQLRRDMGLTPDPRLRIREAGL